MRKGPLVDPTAIVSKNINKIALYQVRRRSSSETFRMPGAAQMVVGGQDAKLLLGTQPSKLTRVRSENTLKLASGEEIGGTDMLSGIDWVQELFASPGTSLLATVGAMSTPSSKTVGIDPDHLFLSMLRQKLICDICFMWNSNERLFHTIVAMGPDVAGHPRITHGGFTSALIDETTGGLVFELKKAGLAGEGPAFTAHLEVDFKKPLPVNTVAVCTARVESMEGRKIWTYAEMLDRPGGTVFATGKALYVTPKQNNAPPADQATKALPNGADAKAATE